MDRKVSAKAWKKERARLIAKKSALQAHRAYAAELKAYKHERSKLRKLGHALIRATSWGGPKLRRFRQ